MERTEKLNCELEDRIIEIVQPGKQRKNKLQRKKE